MADYSKNTVAQIREIFKQRGIPTTGLSKKQQFIDRLVEKDAEGDADDAVKEGDAAEAGDTAEAQATDEDQEERQDEAAAQDATGPDDQPTESAALNDASREEVEAAADAEALEKPDVREKDQKPLLTGNTDVEKDVPAFENAAKVVESAAKDAEEAGTPPALAPVVGTGADNTGDAPLADVTQGQDVPHVTIPDPAASPSSGSRKRKRRSPTPSVDSAEIASKKVRPSAEGPEVIMKEDVAAVSGEEMPASNDDQAMDKYEVPAVVAEAAAEESKAEEVQQQAQDAADEAAAPMTEAVVKGEDGPLDHAATIEVSRSIDVSEPAGSRPGSPIAPTKLPPGREGRYKELISPTGQETKDLDGTMDTLPDDPKDRSVAPATHPATNALYIRDLMRPLKDVALKTHLASLARPPSKSKEFAANDDETVPIFYLDTIKTHCFATFPSVSAASRVRNATHDRVWPPEGNRKPLWVDFIPEDKVQSWIDTEQQAGGSRASTSKRWEVVYELDDGSVRADLREAAPGGGTAPPRRPTAPSIPSGPSAAASTTNAPDPPNRTPSITLPPTPTIAQQTPSFLTLDTLFKSTTTKPKLYYLPVAKDLAEKRLDELDARTSRGGGVPMGGSGWPDNTRFTFEEGDLLVDNGPEFGLRTGGRGGRGRGGGGAFRGR